MFWILTAVSLDHGFGKDSRPIDARVAYETALVGPFTPVAASELELTGTQMFLLSQALTLACVGAARLATASLLFEVWQPQVDATTAYPSKVSVRREKWLVVGVSTLCTCFEQQETTASYREQKRIPLKYHMRLIAQKTNTSCVIPQSTKKKNPRRLQKKV